MLGIDILNHATGPIADIPTPEERFQCIVDGEAGSVLLPRFERVPRLPKGIVTVYCHMAGELEVSNDRTPYITASTGGPAYWNLFLIECQLSRLGSNRYE